MEYKDRSQNVEKVFGPPETCCKGEDSKLTHIGDLIVATDELECCASLVDGEIGIADGGEVGRFAGIVAL